MERNFLNSEKAVIQKSTAKIIFKGKNVYKSPLRSGIRKGMYYHQYCLSENGQYNNHNKVNKRYKEY